MIDSSSFKGDWHKTQPPFALNDNPKRVIRQPQKRRKIFFLLLFLFLKCTIVVTRR
nr:MAG TPA: hypothetical protein [Caudoviricetes sp.]